MTKRFPDVWFSAVFQESDATIADSWRNTHFCGATPPVILIVNEPAVRLFFILS